MLIPGVQAAKPQKVTLMVDDVPVAQVLQALDTIAPGWRTLELHADGTLTTEVHRLADTRFQPDTASEGY